MALSLTSYGLLLIYGFPRYEPGDVKRLTYKLMVTGALLLAALAAATLMLAVFAYLGLAELAGLPLLQLWLAAAVGLLLTVLLKSPAQILAARLVCHGRPPAAGELDSWRNQLLKANGWQAQLDVPASLLPEPTDTALDVRSRKQRLMELGELAAIVAHDLRNPLNNIGMLAAGAREEVREEIAAQIERADHLIRDLLDYSGTLQIATQPINLLAACRRAVDYAGNVAVPFSLEIAENLKVQADPARFQQMLGNLLQNALAALQSRADARVCLYATRDADRVTLQVCDNGPGVPTEQRQQLFDVFQGHRPDGNGLGLAIVRRLAEAQHGSVRISERPGWACCFELELPCAQA